MRDEKIGEAMDDLLKASAREALAPPTDLCVDAERLAAWSDGSLSRSETEMVEIHLAGCARCQAMLATMAVTMPSQPAAVVVPFWQRWHVRWVAPIAAAAAALLVWVVLPDPPAEESVATTMARAEPTAALPAEPPTLQPPSGSGSVGGGGGGSAQRRSRTPGASAGSDLEKAGDPQMLARSAPSAAALEQRRGNGGNRTIGGVSPMPEDAVQGRQQGVAIVPLPASAPSSTAAVSPAPPPPSPPAAPPPPATSEPFAAPRMVSTERVQVADTAAVQARSGGRSFALAPADPLEIVAATPRLVGGGTGDAGRGGAGRGGSIQARAAQAPLPPATRWRVLPDGRIERSTSGGSSWEPTGSATFPGLIAGAAPSNTVCWIVGRSGLVLRTTDGLTFSRVPFPEAADLLTITAVDARQATVTTATGNTYTTTDGGVSWQ